MTDLRKAAEQALEALRNAEVVHMEQLNAMYALQEALAQPEQEPIAWMHQKAGGYRYYSWRKEYLNDIPLYTKPHIGKSHD